MRVCALIAVILCFLTTINATHARSTLESRELGLADMPTCGLQCILSTVPPPGCALTDLSCVCHNAHLAHSMSACLLANCTMANSTRTAKVQATLCNLSNESKTTQVFLYAGIIYFTAILFVALRIVGKTLSKRLALDDLIIVLALLLTALPLSCILAMGKLGFGKHLWDLQEGALLPILRFFLVSSSSYVIVLGLIKISLILFYLQIFKTTRFAFYAYIVLGYIVVSSIVIFFLTIFACKPVESFWNRDIKGKCMDIQRLAYANSASAILQDLVLLILPLVFIRNLKLKRYRKLALALMFSIGSFGCVATIIQLQTLLSFGISIDPTWDYVPVTIWTELELGAGFICVSLPSIRILLARILPERIKEFFSQITHPSSKVNSGPKYAPPQREWKRPDSWMGFPTEVDESARSIEQRKSFVSAVWTRYSGTNFTSTTRRASESARNRPVELLVVPNLSASPSARQSWNTCVSQNERDLPLPAIGCLPEGNFSDLILGRSSANKDRKPSGDNHA